jgi:ABC-type dipeptide/oligopeptide/nickel transport system permease subunit
MKRSVLAEVLLRFKATLILTGTALLLSTTVGIALGVASATRPNSLLDRVSAMASLFGASMPSFWLGIVLMVVFAIVGFPFYTRLVRGVVLSLREREFVEAARALGAGDAVILGRHVLPHLVSPAIVAFSLDVSAKILITAGLSFLGLGTQPPTADWGSMLAPGRQFVILSPHVALLPGLAIFLIVLALNVVGDALRDVLDPHTSAD